MILVVLSTVKIYFVYFGQKNRRNSLLKVALGVALEVLLNIYNHTWGHGCQGSWCNSCGWKCRCIYFFPSYLSQGLLLMLIFHAVIIEIWKWFKNLHSIAWCLNPLLKFLPLFINHLFIFHLFSSLFLGLQGAHVFYRKLSSHQPFPITR